MNFLGLERFIENKNTFGGSIGLEIMEMWHLRREQQCEKSKSRDVRGDVLHGGARKPWWMETWMQKLKRWHLLKVLVVHRFAYVLATWSKNIALDNLIFLSFNSIHFQGEDPGKKNCIFKRLVYCLSVKSQRFYYRRIRTMKKKECEFCRYFQDVIKTVILVWKYWEKF